MPPNHSQDSSEPVDIGILTVIPEELDAARSVLEPLVRDKKGPNETVYLRGTVRSKLRACNYTVVLAGIGKAGNSRAAAIATQMIERYRPSMVLLMGIAAGMRGKVRIGEVVLSDRIVAYEPAALVAGKDGARQVEHRPDITDVPQGPRQDVLHYQLEPLRLAAIFKHIRGTFPHAPTGQEDEWKQHVASSITCRKQVTIASGEKLLRDPNKLLDIRREIHGKVEAVEMEAAGFVDACELASVPWLVIRGISDFGDDLKNDAFHGFASRSAAAVLADFIAHGLDLGERYCADVRVSDVTADGSGSHPEQSKVSQRVTSMSGGNPASQAREISNEPLEWDFFLAYASADRSLAESLYAALSTNHRVFLDVHAVRPGDDWPRTISRALAATRLTIILISANSEEAHYLHNEISIAIQLARKDAKRRRVIPVFLDGFPSDVTAVPYGLGSIQGLDARKLGMEGIAVELRKAAARQGSGSEIERSQVNQVVTSTAVGDAVSQAHKTSSLAQDENHTPADHIPVPKATDHFQRPQGRMLTLGDLERLDNEKPEPSAHVQARDALDELKSWATNPAAPPFFALLGEYGIGKTTTLKQFTRLLLEQRKSNPEIPLPIYVDLRDYVSTSRESVPTIEQLLASVIQRRWNLRSRTITPQDVLRLVQEEGAIILFDGLDEKLVHLPLNLAHHFIRTLRDVLPDAAQGRVPPSPGKCWGKLLISCRSHYFRDVWSQNAMLVGGEREGIDRNQFPALCLLPFTEEQIRGYLDSFLGGMERGAEAFEVIASIHNLRELAERPYLLSLISGRIGELEKLQARGEKVNAARLYDLVVRSWINDDSGKHQLDPLQKRRLMEDLAAALWRDGSKHWDVERLETWLSNCLPGSPDDPSKDRLKDDLRTATFVLRPTTEEEHFRFAHTSLQEYFLAAYLKRALIEKKAERWDLPMVSRETFDFLGQILALEPESGALRSLDTILGGDNLRAAMLAFAYWLRALKQDLPVPTPARVNLAGANLEEWNICGCGPNQPLNLRRADLSNVRLNRARLEHVEFAGANLTAMQARQALFLNVSASYARAQGADFRGLQWRGGLLVGADLAGAQLDGCQWVWVRLTEAILPEGWERHATVVEDLRPPSLRQPSTLSLATTLGHTSWVSTCGWSPDGQRLLSGSDDTNLKVWDAGSGTCLLTLSGHTSWVSTCAWSPNGQRLLSGSVDTSLKIWDAKSGACLLTLLGHTNSVNTSAWSPDGQRLLSGSSDSSLKVWDAKSGACLLTLSGHASSVKGCTWSPDSQRLLSGSDDTNLKVWDAETGACLLTLSGHTSSVSACAWSPDGQRLLSGSDDTSLKVWDAKSGACLFTLSGHTSSVSACAWSPDGLSLLSSSDDTSLKIWDAKSGACLLTLSGHTGSVTTCAWSQDSRYFLSGSIDTNLKVWDAKSGACLFTLSGHASWARACAWSLDNQWLLSGSVDSSLKVWDVKSGACLLTLSGHSGSASACAWSPDGQRLLSGSVDSSLRIWNAKSGACLLTLSGHADVVTACAWSPDGQRLVSGSDDTTLKLWDANSGECLFTLSGHDRWVRACAWSPDSQHLLSGSVDSSLKVWDAKSGECLLTLSGHTDSVTACAWSPDGQRLLSGSDDTSLKVWDAKSGECLLTLLGHSSWVRACAWSPDGQRVLSGSEDNSLKVWDAGSGTCLLKLSGHTSSVRACAWSPDGHCLLSSSIDGSLRIWDASSGQCLWSGRLFPEGQTASLDEVQGRILHASPEAWRWLGWRWTDPTTGQLRILPAETFGPLPT